MKISYNWLRLYIQTDLPAQEVSEILTNIGLEVEGLESVQSVKGGLEGVVIGEVLSCEKHPDADRLSVCKVRADGDATIDVVCGAPNARTGMKGVFAPAGSYVPGIDLVLKKAKIRGVESQGMLLMAGDRSGALRPASADAEPGSTVRPVHAA